MVIYSYGRVHGIRWMIYSIWLSPSRNWPLPRPVPWVAVVYFLVLAAAFLVLDRLPLFGTLLGWMPWPLRLFTIPALVTYVGMTQRLDGRYPHRWLLSFAAFHLRPRCTSAGRRVRRRVVLKPRVRVTHDAHSPTLHKGCIVGPGTVRFNTPVRFRLSLVSTSLVAVGDEGGDTPVRTVDGRLGISA